MLSVHVGGVKCDSIELQWLLAGSAKRRPCSSSIAISTNRHFGQAETAVNGFLMERSGFLLRVLEGRAGL